MTDVSKDRYVCHDMKCILAYQRAKQKCKDAKLESNRSSTTTDDIEIEMVSIADDIVVEHHAFEHDDLSDEKVLI